MGSKDTERHEESRAEGQEQRELKKGRHIIDTNFEKLKAEKFGTKEEPNSDASMLEWIELNKQLQINKDTGRPYNMTTTEKSKAMFFENPLVPIGN